MSVRTQTRIRRLLQLTLSILCLASLSAQAPQGRVTGGWRMPLMEDNRLRTLLTGDSAQPQDDGSLLISKVRIQIYTEAEPPEVRLTITAPECRFDVSNQVASSDGSIALNASDQRFSVTGRGFLWNQDTENLTISNAVETAISRTALGETEGDTTDAPPIEVRSRQFSYDKSQNLGIYRDQVEAIEGERFRMTCQLLQVRLPDTDESDREIVASGGVQIQLKTDDRTVELTGEKADYQSEGESQSLILQGQPTWKSGEYSGSGNRIVVTDLETNPVFTVSENARMTLPTAATGTLTDGAAAAGNETISLQADQYTVSGSEAEFVGNVQAISAEDWAIRTSRLTAAFDADAQALTRIYGDERIEITQTIDGVTTTARSDRVQFIPTENGLSDILLTGNASVESDEYQTEGDRIQLRRTANDTAIDARGNVSLTFERDAGSGMGILGISTPSGSNQTRSVEPGQPQTIRITADQYQLQSSVGRFQDNVVVTDAEGQLTCRLLDIEFGDSRRSLRSLTAIGNVQVTNPEAQISCHELVGYFSSPGNTLQRLVANTGVEIRNAKGIASGNKAVFLVPEQTVELTGDPELRTRLADANQVYNVLTTADTLIWDQATDTFKGRGQYRIRTIPNQISLDAQPE